MYASRDNLVNDFDDKDRALYDWVIQSYIDKYDINPEENPSDGYDLHRLATEIVRAERGRGHIIEEGEVHENEVTDEEGQIVINSDGDVHTEKSQHYLHDMLYRQDNKITKLEKELGITRKERERRSSADNAVDAIKQFSDIGAAFLDREDTDYDPDGEPWNESDSDGSDSG
jgi:hypothetical protein